MSATPTDRVEGFSQTDWDQVHEQIQTLLAPLANHVRQRLPEIRSQPGRTAGRTCFLYSYHEFMWPNEDDVEDVVVGVSFVPSAKGQGICASGDIGGGETGHTYYEIEEREIAPTPAVVLTIAQEITSALSKQVEVVVSALRERRHPPDYRGGGLQKK